MASQKEKNRGEKKVERRLDEERSQDRRDQPGERNFEQGRAKQHRFEQGGGGGSRGGGGGKKKGGND